MALFTPARKENLRARVAICGPTGAGKTWTALQLARILAGERGRIGFVDTENRSAAYYAPDPRKPVVERLNWWDPPYEFGHLPWSPPYDPRKLTEMILSQQLRDELGDDGVLVIDSGTHFWNGDGGTLDVVDHASRRSGNSFVGWSEGTPAQRGLLDAIVHAPFHVVFCMRSKMEYLLQEEVKNGRKITVPTKVGMAPEQRAGIEYEFTVVADMDLEHRLIVSKSRCDLIADAVATKGESSQVWTTFRDWLATGVQPISDEDAAAILELLNSPTDKELKIRVKTDFVARFGGTPDKLMEDQADTATRWVREQLGIVDVEAAPVPQAVPDEPAADEGTPETADGSTAPASCEFCGEQIRADGTCGCAPADALPLAESAMYGPDL